MSLERITTQRVLEELKAGNSVFILQEADMTSVTIADWLTEEFAIEVPEEDKQSKAPKTQGGVKPLPRKSWTGARSRPCIMRGGPMQRSQMKWAAPLELWTPV